MPADTRFKVAEPSAEQGNPYIPPGPTEPLMFEEFGGINTATTRPGVDDKQMYWCDGFIPLARMNLRTLPGVGPALFTPPDGDTVQFFDFFNIGTTPYMLAIVSTGEIYAVNTNTGVATSIAPDGTITSPTRASVGLTQWGAQYVLIVANQTNGYWIWDGTNFYKPGGIGPVVTVTNGGTGYTGQPTFTPSGFSGSGLAFFATIVGGVITAISVTNPGTGGLASDTVTVAISGGGGSAATMTVSLMPFGIQGTAIETYSGRVWIANGPTITFSAPGSFTNFASASGGGNFTSSDSFLRVGYVELIQTNGFLYLIADSSVNYISGVQTAGSPTPITTFTNQNADPEVGTPWASTVDVFGRNIVFANAVGAHVSYGAAVTKISEPLDGIYNTVPNFGNALPSAAKTIVFGKKVWMLLLPIIDPITGQQTNKLLMWNGKIWWASGQDVPLRFVQHQEIDSVITAYGTDGLSVYPLFAQPSVNFTKVAQSKLWATPGGVRLTKAVGRLWGVFQYNSLSSPNVNVSIDSETSSANNIVPTGPLTATWTNGLGAVVPWINASAVVTPWVYTGPGGLTVIPPTQVGQYGALVGMTVTTNCADMAIVSLSMDTEIVQGRY